ncbi:MAG TPA: carotenoid biosynthesis protein [Bacteroidales bacterium]|jgi:bisanhydrobacterioruberin hydratase|nr:carotenoid biosynthesis protein [Bacteroidales bacterium]HBZ21619.1 carotenoid biosynthesis protein [Bacteroidales bacterium]
MNPGMINTEKSKLIRVILIIFYSVGIAGISSEATRDLFKSLTPLALLLSLLVIFIYHKPSNLKKEIIFFISVFAAGFLIEAFGVNTGRVFGTYSYGNGLGVKVFGTPLLIGINWVLLVWCTAVIVEKTAIPALIKILFASSVMVLYDVIMEQVAPVMNMWSFDEGNPPLRNYTSWFLIAVIFHSLLKLAGIKPVNRIAPFVLFIQAMFFIILIIFFKIAS